MDLFKEVLPSLLQTKKSIITPENEKEYKPYIVNRAISQHNDTILYVNEMNRFPNLDNKLQYNQLLLPGARAYSYLTSSEKVTKFMEWLQQQIDAGILDIHTLQQIG